ncbi:protein cbp-1-like [Microplitis demolitor]|uniref:protein cbp-1-like n=1 Tax=Microplitis demolitor TaxID=69319 RepID=UPI00235B68B7|nr:protein cbp-1-like [Microplitis demolitor]
MVIMDKKEEQMSGNDDGSPNSQEVRHPQGSNAGVQMQIQQQQQTHMSNQARNQSPRQHQRFDHGTIVGPGQGGPSVQAPSSMGQMGASSSHGNGSTSSTHDLKHRKLIQQQLVLLLHAHKCQIRERQANGEARICALPHCKTMKNVLTHMKTCEEGIGCTIPFCSSSRQIIAHWRQCQKSDCPVCLPLKQADRNKAANSRAAVAASQPNPNPDIRKPFDTMGIIQGQKTTSGMIPNQAVGRGVRMPGPGMQGPPGSMAAGIRLAQPQAQQSPGQSIVNQGQPIAPNVSLSLSSDPTTVVVSTNQPASTTGPTSVVAAAATANLQQQAVNMLPGGFQPAQATKEWQRTVTSDLRNHLVHKLVQAIILAPDPQATYDERLHNLVAYARKVEGYMYKMANSRSEYYHLFAESIYKIHQQQQLQQQQVGTLILNAVSTIPQAPSPLSTLQQQSNQQQFTNTQPLPATTPVDNGISVNTPQTIPPASSGPSPGSSPTTNDPQSVVSTSSTPHNNKGKLDSVEKENVKIDSKQENCSDIHRMDGGKIINNDVFIKTGIKQEPMEESSADGNIKEEPYIKEEPVIPMSRLYQDPKSLCRQTVDPSALGTNTIQILCGYGKRLCTILRDTNYYSYKNGKERQISVYS